MRQTVSGHDPSAAKKIRAADYQSQAYTYRLPA
jgi:hypothetical protein